MAAQLGQGFQAKDTEDGARIGAAVSEIETGEDIGRTAAEDPRNHPQIVARSSELPATSCRGVRPS